MRARRRVAASASRLYLSHSNCESGGRHPIALFQRTGDRKRVAQHVDELGREAQPVERVGIDAHTTTDPGIFDHDEPRLAKFFGNGARDGLAIYSLRAPGSDAISKARQSAERVPASASI